jgi:tetratricopeptide (TPR) repeat protein
MMRRGPWHLGGGAVLACLLAACGTAPPAVKPPAEAAPLPPVTTASPLPAFEKAQQERALALARQGRLADAAVAWEVLSVLRPDVAEYRDRLAEARQQIDEGVADHLQKAEQARKRGDLDAAQAQYLQVLSLQPEHAVAADALRATERERNKRSYLGKRSRITLARRPAVEAADAGADRNDLEHAAMLSSAGEFDEAIALLEKRLAANPRDGAARSALSDVYYQKADKLGPRRKAAAIAALEKAVRLDPGNARAVALLKVMRTGEAR